MYLNPHKAVNEGWIKLSKYSKIQQSGVDVTLKELTCLKTDKAGWFPLTLQAGDCYAFECQEFIKVPKDCIAQLIVRSTFNRQGMYITTGLYDNGFKGFIGGTLHVRGKNITLNMNERIAQVCFIKCEHEAQYDGQYQQKG